MPFLKGCHCFFSCRFALKTVQNHCRPNTSPGFASKKKRSSKASPGIWRDVWKFGCQSPTVQWHSTGNMSHKQRHIHSTASCTSFAPEVVGMWSMCYFIRSFFARLSTDEVLPVMILHVVLHISLNICSHLYLSLNPSWFNMNPKSQAFYKENCQLKTPCAQASINHLNRAPSKSPYSSLRIFLHQNPPSHQGEPWFCPKFWGLS